MDNQTRDDMQKVAKACTWFVFAWCNRPSDYEYATLNELSALSDLRSTLAALRREAVPSNIGTAS